MPAGPVGACWESGSWEDTAWEDGAWGDGEVSVSAEDVPESRTWRLPDRGTEWQLPERDTTWEDQ
jgi:hypothetical protein